MKPDDRHTFSRDERLNVRTDFRRCIRQGGRAAAGHIIVYVAKNGLGLTRLGAGSTRRLGGAPLRNRGKRLVREAFRLAKHELPEGLDLVVLPVVPWNEPTLDDLKTELVDAVRRAEADLAAKMAAGRSQRGPKK